MKKLKLKSLTSFNAEILDRGQLKEIMGGSGWNCSTIRTQRCSNNMQCSTWCFSSYCAFRSTPLEGNQWQCT
jgi:natural product precursor